MMVQRLVAAAVTTNVPTIPGMLDKQHQNIMSGLERQDSSSSSQGQTERTSPSMHASVPGPAMNGTLCRLADERAVGNRQRCSPKSGRSQDTTRSLSTKNNRRQQQQKRQLGITTTTTTEAKKGTQPSAWQERLRVRNVVDYTEKEELEDEGIGPHEQEQGDRETLEVHNGSCSCSSSSSNRSCAPRSKRLSCGGRPQPKMSKAKLVVDRGSFTTFRPRSASLATMTFSESSTRLPLRAGRDFERRAPPRTLPIESCLRKEMDALRENSVCSNTATNPDIDEILRKLKHLEEDTKAPFAVKRRRYSSAHTVFPPGLWELRNTKEERKKELGKEDGGKEADDLCWPSGDSGGKQPPMVKASSAAVKAPNENLSSMVAEAGAESTRAEHVGVFDIAMDIAQHRETDGDLQRTSPVFVEWTGKKSPDGLLSSSGADEMAWKRPKRSEAAGSPGSMIAAVQFPPTLGAVPRREAEHCPPRGERPIEVESRSHDGSALGKSGLDTGDDKSTGSSVGTAFGRVSEVEVRLSSLQEDTAVGVAATRVSKQPVNIMEHAETEDPHTKVKRIVQEEPSTAGEAVKVGRRERREEATSSKHWVDPAFASGRSKHKGQQEVDSRICGWMKPDRERKTEIAAAEVRHRVVLHHKLVSVFTSLSPSVTGGVAATGDQARLPTARSWCNPVRMGSYIHVNPVLEL